MDLITFSKYAGMGILLLIGFKVAEIIGAKVTEGRIACRILSTYRANKIDKIDKCREQINSIKDTEIRTLLNKYLDRSILFNYSIDIPFPLRPKVKGESMPAFSVILESIENIVEGIKKDEITKSEILDINDGFDDSFESILKMWEKEINEFEEMEGKSC